MRGAPNPDPWVVVLRGAHDRNTFGTLSAAAWSQSGALLDVGCRSTPSLVVIDDALAGYDERLCRAFLDLLYKTSPRVWVHLGRANSDTVTRKDANARWNKALREERFHCLSRCAMNPFSRSTELKWDRELQSLVEAMGVGLRTSRFKSFPERLRRLAEAWRTANAYYDVVQPLLNWGNEAWPLYVAVCAGSQGRDQLALWRDTRRTWRRTHSVLAATAPLEGDKGLLQRAKSLLDVRFIQELADTRKAARLLEEFANSNDATSPSKEDAEQLLRFSKLCHKLRKYYIG